MRIWCLSKLLRLKERSMIKLTQHQCSGAWGLVCECQPQSVQQDSSEPFKTGQGRFPKVNSKPFLFLNEQLVIAFTEAFGKPSAASRYSNITLSHTSSRVSVGSPHIHTYIFFTLFRFLYKNKVILHSCHQLKLGLQSEMKNCYCTN